MQHMRRIPLRKNFGKHCTKEFQPITLIAQVFKENISPAFATYHTSKATSFTITFVLSTFICLRPRLYISIALYLVGLVGYVISELRLRRKQSAENKEVDDQNMGSFSSQKKLENDFSS
ncbi:protein unc-93 A isoform X2 [Biomphalaria glabrata]